jgi:phospholipid-binding lipoprotein MlaA
MYKFRKLSVVIFAPAFLTLVGCAHDPKNPDPYEKTNRSVYKFNDLLDRTILKPFSGKYSHFLPPSVRTGISNVFSNLAYPGVILNDFLQGKVGQGLGDAARMGVNSTVGIAGVFDPASKWGLHEHSNDFGITLGKWGAGPGPYLVLPFFGPSTFRDAPKIPVGMVTNVMYWVSVPLPVEIATDAIGAAEDRASAEGVMNFRDIAAIDPYIFTRDAYLQLRHTRIYGQPRPVSESFYDEVAPATKPASRPTTQSAR